MWGVKCNFLKSNRRPPPHHRTTAYKYVACSITCSALPSGSMDSPISSSASLAAPRFRCFDPLSSATSPNHSPRSYFTSSRNGSMENLSYSEPKIVTGDSGYVLEDVPHFTDYIPDLPVTLSLFSLSPSVSLSKGLFGY